MRGTPCLSLNTAQLAGHIQHAPNNTFIGIRSLNASANSLYSEFDASNKDFTFENPEHIEMYDMVTDVDQMINLAKHEDPAKLHQLHKTLHSMLHCTGTSGNSSCFLP